MFNNRQETIKELEILKGQYEQLLSLTTVDDIIQQSEELKGIEDYTFNFKLFNIYYYEFNNLDCDFDCAFQDYAFCEWENFTNDCCDYNGITLHEFYCNNYTSAEDSLNKKYIGLCKPFVELEYMLYDNSNYIDACKYINDYIESIDLLITLIDYIDGVDDVESFVDFAENHADDYIGGNK